MQMNSAAAISKVEQTLVVVLGLLIILLTFKAADARPAITIKIDTPKAVLAVGETIQVVVSYINTSHTFSSVRLCADRYSIGVANIGIVVYLSSGQVPAIKGGWTRCSTEEVPPHETVYDHIPADRFYDMSKPGIYKIQVIDGTIKSNIIQVRVVPTG